MNARSLMRTVAPSGGDFAVRSAATVLPAPGRFSTTNCCPSAAVHFAASMRAKVSGLPPGASPTRTRTGFCGQACGLAIPDHTAAARPNNSAKRFIPPPFSELRVNAQQISESTPAADGRSPHSWRCRNRDVSRGGSMRFFRSFDTVRVVHQPEEQLRFRGEPQSGKRLEIAIVGAIDGTGMWR